MIGSAIIGCGKIAGGAKITDSTTHAGAYLSNNNFKLKACYDRKFEKAKLFGKKFNCASEKSISELIRIHTPEVISICTPDHTHLSIIKNILEENINTRIIILEKPATSNEKDFFELLKISRGSDVRIVVNHTRRFDHKHQKIKDLIKANKFGKLISCEASYYGGWVHNGVHVIDTLHFLLNKNLFINALHNTHKSKYIDDILVDLEIGIGSKNSKNKIMIKSYDESHYQILEFDMKFSKGRLRIENFGNIFRYEKKIKNKLNENILAADSISFSNKSLTAMENLLNFICKSLINKNFSSIREYEIQSTIKTMNIIWEGIRLAKK